MDPSVFVPAVSASQSTAAAEEAEDDAFLPESSVSDWPPPSEFAILGLGLLAAAGVMGILYAAKKIRMSRVTSEINGVPGISFMQPTPAAHAGASAAQQAAAIFSR